jgi:transposase
MAKKIVSDELWSIVEPLLPPPQPKPRGGRPPVSNRAALTGILFVLRSGIPWEMLPQEMGCGSSVTCWRRLRDWQEADVWDRLRQTLLEHLQHADQLDWERACMYSAPLPAKKGAQRSAPTRQTEEDRAQSGTS